MKKKKLGNKYVCFQCGCKFYDLARAQPLCPKCGADQTEARKKVAATSRPAASDVSPPPPRSRKRKVKEDEWEGSEGSFEDDDDSGDEEAFNADGLSLVEEEELDGNEDAENTR